MIYIYKPVQRLLNYLLTWSVLCFDLDIHIWTYKYFHSKKEAYKFYNDYNQKLKIMQDNGELDKIHAQEFQRFLAEYKKAEKHIR